MRIVPIVNQKGGVGKTTVCRHLMKLLTESGYRVLAVDMDAPRNLDPYLGCDINYSDSETLSMYHVLRQETSIKNVIVHTEDGSGDIARADNRMYSFTGKPMITYEEYLSFEGDTQGLLNHLLNRAQSISDNNTGERTILRRALEEIKDDYDYVLIDTNPDLGYLTTLSLLSGTEIYPLIPAFAEESSLQSLYALYDTISTLLLHDYRTNIKIVGVLISKYERTNNEDMLLEDITSFSRDRGFPVFDTKLPKTIAVAEGMATASDAFSRRKNSPLETAYRNFCAEFLNRMNVISNH